MMGENVAQETKQFQLWLNQMLTRKDLSWVIAGAHNPERSTAINSCYGVFTSEFIFRYAFPTKNNCSTRPIPPFDRRLDC